MEQKDKTFEYPQLIWPNSGWYLTAIGTLAGIGVLVFPNASGSSLVCRLAIALTLASTPAIFVLIVHMSSYIRVYCRRARCYEQHMLEISELKNKLSNAQGVITELVQRAAEHKAYDISYCFIYEDQPYIALRRKRGSALTLGCECYGD